MPLRFMHLSLIIHYVKKITTSSEIGWDRWSKYYDDHGKKEMRTYTFIHLWMIGKLVYATGIFLNEDK